MKTSVRSRLTGVAFALCVGLLSMQVFAQADYPSRPLRIIVANTPGSTVDLVARKLGEGLGLTLGQPVVIINQPGAGGLLGSQTIAQAPKDGYTLGFYGNTAVIVPHLSKNVGFDALKDITTIAIVGNIPFVVAVPQNSPIKDMRGLVALAKRSPGLSTMGSAGPGTATHLAGMQLQLMAGVELLHVPYKGVAPLQVALIAGEVDIGFPTVGSIAPYIGQGRVRALAVTGAQRSPLMPNVPTVAEAGVPGYSYESWLALVVPAGVPPAVLRRLNDDIRKIVEKEDTQLLFSKNGITSGVLSPEASQQIVNRDYERMGELVRKSGATVN